MVRAGSVALVSVGLFDGTITPRFWLRSRRASGDYREMGGAPLVFALAHADRAGFDILLLAEADKPSSIQSVSGHFRILDFGAVWGVWRAARRSAGSPLDHHS